MYLSLSLSIYIYIYICNDVRRRSPIRIKRLGISKHPYGAMKCIVALLAWPSKQNGVLETLCWLKRQAGNIQ